MSEKFTDLDRGMVLFCCACTEDKEDQEVTKQEAIRYCELKGYTPDEVRIVLTGGKIFEEFSPFTKVVLVIVK